MTRLTILNLLIGVAIALSGCNHHNSEHGHAHGPKTPEVHPHAPASIALTHYSPHTELFVEFPTLLVDSDADFAAHLTWLENHKPVDTGIVNVILSGGDHPEEKFMVTGPASAGIFRPRITPQYAGERELHIELVTEKQRIRHALGIQIVYQDSADIPPATSEEDAAAIRFTKEQQWQTEFSTAVAVPRTLRESLYATATVRAAADKEAVIAAAQDGTLSKYNDQFPVNGTPVQKGRVLAVIGSPLGRELPGGGGGTALRAPINGIIAQTHVAPGSYVQKGQAVFHILDPHTLWLEARIAEIDAPRLQRVHGAWFNLPYQDTPIEIRTAGKAPNGRVISLGQMLDIPTRTVPVIIEFSNPDRKLLPGMAIAAHLVVNEKPAPITVPSTAILRETGMPIAFVQTSGETFERRVLRIGIYDNQYVQILEGIRAGERIVDKGAYLIKLAAANPSTSDHGHAH